MLRDSDSTKKEKIGLSTIQKYLFLGMLFILPLSIIPFPWDWTEKSMSLVILIFSTVIVGIEIIKLIWDGKVTFIKGLLDIGSFSILGSLTLSTLLSEDINTSIWGVDNRLGSGLIVFIAVILVSFAARTFIHNMKDIKMVILSFLGGMFIANILSIFSFLGTNIWSSIPIYKEMHQAGLPLLRSEKVHVLINMISILLSLGIIGERMLRRGGASIAMTLCYVFLVSGIVNLWVFSIHQGLALLILFAVIIILVLIFGTSRLKIGRGLKRDLTILFISILLTIVIPVILLQIPSLRAIIIPKGVELVAEVSLGADISWIIAASVFIDSLWKGLFGLGVDTYTIAYNLFKPLNDALLSFNSVNFYFSGNELFTKFSNGGLIWLAAWIFFGFLLAKQLRDDFRKFRLYQEDNAAFFLVIIDFTLIFLFLASLFVAYSVLVILLLFVIISLHSVLKDILGKGSGDKFVFKLWATNVSSRVESGKALYNMNVFLTVVTVLIGSSLLVFWGSKIISSAYLLRAESYYSEQKKLYAEQDPSSGQREDFVKRMSGYYTKALKFDDNDPLVSRKLGLMYLEQVGIAAERYSKEKETEETNSIIKEIGQWKNYAIDYIRKSIDRSPSIYANWEARARVYMGLVGLGFYDYSADALYSLEKAIELNPLNFELYYYKAQINIINGDKDGALSALTQVLGINPQHVASILLAGEINKEKGNLEVYESYLKAAKKILEMQGNTGIDTYKEISKQLNELAKDTKEDVAESTEPTVPQE